MFKKIMNACYEIAKMFIVCAFTIMLGDELIEDGFEDLLFDGSHMLNIIFVIAWAGLTIGSIARAIYASRACCTKKKENEG